jgi:hypothetical protein
MTLTRLLGIELKLLRYEDERGLQIAERVWESRGCPTEGEALCETLERALCRCMEAGISYPPIVLKRKKQLERGSWSPDTKAVATYRYIVPSDIRKEGRPECPRCRGSGYVVIEGGSHSTFCECNKWHPSQQRNGLN